MTDPCDAIVAGHICLDILPDLSSSAVRPETMFTPGRLVQTGPAAFSSGGPVSNTGLALRRLGIRSRLVGKVGDDLFGRALGEIVSGTDDKDGLVVDPHSDTSYTVIISPPGVDRIFFHCPGANDAFGPEDIPWADLNGARLFHFGYPPVMRRMYERGGRALVDVFRRARQTGVTTSLDLTLPDPETDGGRADWLGILGAVLPYVDVFMPSVEEILFMLRRDDYERFSRRQGGLHAALEPPLLSDLSRELLNLGAGIVGLKLGDRGLYLRTAGRTRLEMAGRARPAHPAAWADRELWAPCFRVTVAGTTGAGDATIAGFLAALLRGLDARQAADMAVAVGACSVEAVDALAGLQGWEETRRRMEKGWERHELSLSTAGWIRDQSTGVWSLPCASGG